MSAVTPPQTRRDKILEAVEDVFWIAIIAAFVFCAIGFVLGVVDPVQMPLVVVITFVLAVIGGMRMRYAQRHRYEMNQDPRLRHARERRGF